MVFLNGMLDSPIHCKWWSLSLQVLVGSIRAACVHCEWVTSPSCFTGKIVFHRFYQDVSLSVDWKQSLLLNWHPLCPVAAAGDLGVLLLVIFFLCLCRLLISLLVSGFPCPTATKVVQCKDGTSGLFLPRCSLCHFTLHRLWLRMGFWKSTGGYPHRSVFRLRTL